MASVKGRWLLFGRINRLFLSESECHTLCTITIWWMKYIISETNISKNIEWRTQIYQYSRKQNSIVWLSRYKKSSLNPQSKLNRIKTSCSTRIFHLTRFAIPTPFVNATALSWTAVLRTRRQFSLDVESCDKKGTWVLLFRTRSNLGSL